MVAGDTPVLVHNEDECPVLNISQEDVDAAFHPATLGSPEGQFLYHFKKWGMPAGMTQQEYFDAATSLSRRLSQRGGAVGWVQNLTPIGFAGEGLKGISYINPETGELLIKSTDGRIVTYHPATGG